MVGGYPVEPVDVHASVRHLDVLYDKLTLTDKVAHAYSLGKERVEDVMEMVRIAGGLTHEEFGAAADVHKHQFDIAAETRHSHVGWVDATGTAQSGLGCNPFTLAGAMAPVTMAAQLRNPWPRGWLPWPWRNGYVLARPV